MIIVLVHLLRPGLGCGCGDDHSWLDLGAERVGRGAK
jgi:hypothetical protein